MKITPNFGSIHKTDPFSPTKTPVGPGSSTPPVSLPSELYIPQSAPPSAAPPSAAPPPAAAGLPEPPAAEFKAEAPPSPAPPPPPKPPETQNWMDQAWNLGPASPGLNPSQDDFWKYPSPKSSDLHQKSILIEPDATYFVSGSHPGAGSALGGITNFNQQAMDLQMKMAEDMKAKQAAYYAENSPPSAPGMITNFHVQALDQQMKIGEEMKAKQAAYYPENSPASAPGMITNFHVQALDQQMKIAEEMKAKQASYYASNPTSSSNIDSAQQASAVTATAAASAPAAAEAVAAKPALPTVGGMTRAQVIEGVNSSLKALQLDSDYIHYAVDEKLFPALDKIKLNPVEFFTARACWQGVHTKRRAQLEAVLDQFPKLPKDQKNWQSAVAAAKAGGASITKSDEVFIQYFIENRKEMKQLFRATLPSGFQGNTALCYRGQSSSSQYGPHSTKPLGCYSIDPGVSESWGDGNFKQFKVKLSDVWSTYTATQNNNRCERELTVYSQGGIRRGQKVSNVQAAKQEFQARYASDTLSQGLEYSQYKGY